MRIANQNFSQVHVTETVPTALNNFIDLPISLYADMKDVNSYILVNNLLIYKNKKEGITVWDKESIEKLKTEENKNDE